MYLQTFLKKPNTNQNKTQPLSKLFFFEKLLLLWIKLFTNIQQDDISPSDLKICQVSKTKHVKITYYFSLRGATAAGKSDKQLLADHNFECYQTG